MEEKKTGLARVVKIITKKLLQGNQLKRIHYEIQLLRRCDHPNIVKLIRWYENKEKIYIVLERSQGYELFDLLDARRRKANTE